MRALRVWFWLRVTHLTCRLAAWAWARYQFALAMHRAPMRAQQRYVAICRWNRAAVKRLNTARLA